MRSTSSARRALAALLCVLVAAGTGCPPAVAGEPLSAALILAFHASDVPEETARARMDVVSRQLPAKLRVAWVTLPAQADAAGTTADPPDADSASLERIAARLADAAMHMERMETREAELLLDASEREARAFRPGESLRPYLAEIFLRRGLLRLWGANRAGAVEMFDRVRALRPDFAPDPALFSPSFRDSWSRAAARAPAGAEILVQSLPPGAVISVDGTKAGATPARVRVPVLSRVVIRLTRPGYLPVERAGHWLPGDSEMLDFTLTRDRLSRLEELLGESGGGKEAGVLLGGMVSAAGAERVAVFVLAGRGAASRVRILSLARGDDEPAAAGEFAWPEGGDGSDEAAMATAAALLERAGWPAVPGDTRAAAPWYHKWWIWVLLGAAVAGAAVAAGGGGGSSGGSTGAIGVNF